jgi:hypothetical protein
MRRLSILLTALFTCAGALSPAQAASSPEEQQSPPGASLASGCAQGLVSTQGFLVATMGSPTITGIAQQANLLLDGIVTQATQAGLAGSLIEELSPSGERQRVLEFSSALDKLQLPTKSGLPISELPSPLQEVVLKVIRLYIDQAPEALQKSLIRSVELYDRDEAQIYLRIQGSDRADNADRSWFIFIKAESSPSFVIEWVALDDSGVDIQSILRVQAHSF